MSVGAVLTAMLQSLSDIAVSGNDAQAEKINGLKDLWVEFENEIETFVGKEERIAIASHQLSHILPDTLKWHSRDPTALIGGGLNESQKKRQATLQGIRTTLIKTNQYIQGEVIKLFEKQKRLKEQIIYLKEEGKLKDEAMRIRLMIMLEQDRLIREEQIERLKLLEAYHNAMGDLYTEYENITQTYETALQNLSTQRKEVQIRMDALSIQMSELSEQIEEKEQEIENQTLAIESTQQAIYAQEMVLENHLRDYQIVEEDQTSQVEERQQFTELEQALAHYEEISNIEHQYKQDTKALHIQKGLLDNTEKVSLTPMRVVEMNKAGLDVSGIIEKLHLNNEAYIEALSGIFKQYGLPLLTPPFNTEDFMRHLDEINQMRDIYNKILADPNSEPYLKELRDEEDIFQGYAIETSDPQEKAAFIQRLKAQYGENYPFESILAHDPNEFMRIFMVMDPSVRSTWEQKARQRLDDEFSVADNRARSALEQIDSLDISRYESLSYRDLMVNVRTQTDMIFDDLLAKLNKSLLSDEPESKHLKSVSQAMNQIQAIDKTLSHNADRMNALFRKIEDLKQDVKRLKSEHQSQSSELKTKEQALASLQTVFKQVEEQHLFYSELASQIEFQEQRLEEKYALEVEMNQLKLEKLQMAYEVRLNLRQDKPDLAKANQSKLDQLSQRILEKEETLSDINEKFHQTDLEISQALSKKEPRAQAQASQKQTKNWMVHHYQNQQTNPFVQTDHTSKQKSAQTPKRTSKKQLR